MSAATDYVQLTHAASEIDGTIDEVYAARGSYGNLSLKIASKQDELTEAQLAAANSGITAAKLTADEVALAELVDSGEKNLWLPEIPTLPSGMTADWDSDGGLIINGATGSSVITFIGNIYFNTGIKYILSGCPSGGSDMSYRIDIARGANTVISYGDPVEASGFVANTPYQCRIRIAANYTCDNLKFYPMICTKAAWDISHAYKPYCPSMAEMYEMIQALQSGTRSAPALSMAESEVEPETGEEEMR